ncbi:MAG: prolipoprotein diacylglyceryl transferase [Oscillospiraceae bacterium]|nr:prolipoprotein diacylglyceryl transferase [Oscillospiraceae bacterium]
MRGLSTMPIGFPGLFGGLEFDPDPIAIPFGESGVYWYAVCITFGLFLGVYVCMKISKRYGIREDDILDGVLIVTPIALIGARLYYILFNLSYFRKGDGTLSLSAMLNVRDGGLAIYGGAIAAFAAAYFFCRRRKLRAAAVADLMVIGFFIGQCIGRWGNFFNREVFGRETTLPWRMRVWVTAKEYIEVHPTFLYESLWNLAGLLFVLFVIGKARKFDGENFCFYCFWYGLGRFWIEELRIGSDALELFGWTLFGRPLYVSQALSLVLAVFGGAMLVYQLLVKKRDGRDLWVDRVQQATPEEKEET